MPLVVTLPPLIAVVPPASVTKLAAFTVPPKVVVPVLFKSWRLKHDFPLRYQTSDIS